MSEPFVPTPGLPALPHRPHGSALIWVANVERIRAFFDNAKLTEDAEVADIAVARRRTPREQPRPRLDRTRLVDSRKKPEPPEAVNFS